MFLNIGVTGHRDLLTQEMPALEARVRSFFEAMAQRYPALELQLLTPLAEGSDQLAARVALDMDIPVVAVLPMARQEYEQDFTGQQQLLEFRRLLDAAQQVIVLPGPARTAAASAAGQLAALSRDWQYAQAGVFISNHCQILLALWDGKAVDAVGGTAQVVHYHLTAVMEGFAQLQSSAHLLADNENDLAYHIVCSRDRPDGAPQDPLQPLQPYWITSQQGRIAADEMPAEYALMLERLQEFDEDVEALVPEGTLTASLLGVGTAGLEVPDSARYVDRLFGQADRLAMYYQRRVNRGLYSIHALAVLMGLVFIIYSEYEVQPWVVWVFLALFFAGVGIHKLGSRRQWHRKYLDYRALAEALRVQFYWNLSGVVDSRSVGFAYENFLQKQDVELGWIRHVMRAASMHRARGIDPDPVWVQWVIDQWIGEEDERGGQLAYYSFKERQNTRKNRQTELVVNTCLWAGILIAIILAAGSSMLAEDYQKLLLVLMGLLPLTAGVRDTIAQKKAEKELIAQYRFMARIFANARKHLLGSRDIAFQRRVLKALGEAALEEGAEWILMHRARPLEHQGLS